MGTWGGVRSDVEQHTGRIWELLVNKESQSQPNYDPTRGEYFFFDPPTTWRIATKMELGSWATFQSARKFRLRPNWKSGWSCEEIRDAIAEIRKTLEHKWDDGQSLCDE